MDLYSVMRTTFSVREFTAEDVPDEVLYRLLENARFAANGGNRQGWRVLIVRDASTREQIAELMVPAIKRYTAQVGAGENPWNTIHPMRVTEATIAATAPPPLATEPLRKAPVVLVVLLDLGVVASMDQYLARVGVTSGASIYPFVWNLLLAARNEGYGGVITTFLTAAEPQAKRLLGIPDEYAIAAVVPIGRPVRQLTRLRRKPVEAFAMRERWGGAPFAPGDPAASD
jgi:nitroreductase